jgi:hypothetical protein
MKEVEDIVREEAALLNKEISIKCEDSVEPGN